MTTSSTPTITLVFRGLFLLAFEKDNKYCQAGIIEADRHRLKINVKSHSPSLQNSPEMSFEIPDGDLSFHVSGRENAVGAYEPGLFERASSHDNRDFRWALDLEGAELHNRRLPIRADALKRSFFITDGQFYTYDSHVVRIVDPSSQTRDVAIAQEIGCDVNLNEKEEAILRYGPNGSCSMKFKKESDVSYDIFVENICPEAGAPQSDVSDFAHYYRVVDVPTGQQFKVDAFSPPPGSDRNPCVPSRLGKTKSPLPIVSGLGWFFDWLSFLIAE
jgi:hypothetical protein